jgi:hypothetical protein
VAATKADAEYLDRMLHLHPWHDAEEIIAERASYLKARRKALADGAAEAGDGEASPVPERRDPAEPRLLPAGWKDQVCEADVSTVPSSHRRAASLGTPSSTWWYWGIGIWLLANVLRGVLSGH